jgi:transposase
MRYPQGGLLTAKGREFREQVRLTAAAMFADGAASAEVARALRVSVRSVERWRAAWRNGGPAALASAGPATHPRLSPEQFARLETELHAGPAAHGWADQRWTLARVKALIGSMFHIPYTVRGVAYLLHRNGWTWQSPTRRAAERDEEAIAVWKKEVWPAVEPLRRPPRRGSSSPTNPDAS